MSGDLKTKQLMFIYPFRLMLNLSIGFEILDLHRFVNNLYQVVVFLNCCHAKVGGGGGGGGGKCHYSKAQVV